MKDQKIDPTIYWYILGAGVFGIWLLTGADPGYSWIFSPAKIAGTLVILFCLWFLVSVLNMPKWIIKGVGGSMFGLFYLIGGIIVLAVVFGLLKSLVNFSEGRVR